ncbi:MAG: CocE/NonD family hydrolase [Turneriella sp.]
MKKNKTIAGLIALAVFAVYCGNATDSGSAGSTVENTQSQTATAPAFSVTDAAVQTAFNALSDGSFTFQSAISIIATDGIKLDGNLMVPTGGNASSRYPAIVFVNSWSLDKAEYLVQAAVFAKKGYIVLTYSTRGFGKSGGLINVAGPKDMDDLRTVLNWLKANTPVDAANIGMAGISYGAGISLLGLAQMSDVKTAAAMSGWGNLENSLWAGQSPQQVWGTILIASGYITGHMDPAILTMYMNLVNYNNVGDTQAWAAVRSPSTYAAQINAAGKPVYMSNNFEDNLFNPNQVLDFYESLTVPKRLDLNQGIHATAEVGGLIGLPNFTWGKVHAWFDYHLKGIQNGIMGEAKLTMESKFTGVRTEFATWPAAQSVKKTWYLKPRGLFNEASLSTSWNSTSTTNEFFSGIDTTASSGIPLLSQILESHVEMPVLNWVNSISRINGIWFESGNFASGLKIRGRVKANARVTLSQSRGQLVAYLYDTDGLNWGKLITFGSTTLHNATPNVAQNVTIKLDASAYDLPAGHSLVLAIDTTDLQFASATSSLYSVKLNYSSGTQQTLEIDTLP